MFFIFRDVFKFTPFALLAFVVLFLLLLKDNKKIPIYVIAGVMLYLIVACPLLTGNLMGNIKPYVLPNEYYDISEDLNSKKIESNVLIFPFAYLFSEFSWNKGSYQMANPLKMLIMKPVIFDEFFNNNLNILQKKYIENFTFDNNFDNKFASLNSVKYIVFQKDQLNTFSRNYSLTQKNINNYSNPNFIEGQNTKYLELYTLKQTLPIIFTPQKISIEQGDFKLASIDILNTVYYKSQEDNSILEKVQNSLLQNSQKPIIEFKKINTTKYRIFLHNVKNTTPLVYNSTFHNGWKIYLTKNNSKILPEKEKINELYKIIENNEQEQATKEEVTSYVNSGLITAIGDLKEKEIKHKKWFKGRTSIDHIEKYNIDFISKNNNGTIQNNNLDDGKLYETWFALKKNGNNLFGLNKNVVELADVKHLIANEYANSWIVDPQEICKNNNFCRKNSDGSYDLELVIELWPQRLFYIGLIITVATIFVLFCYLIFILFKNKSTQKIAQGTK
ncbi:MAG: hypothetical protein WC663_02935 [Patescibacteria group bacterium]